MEAVMFIARSPVWKVCVPENILYGFDAQRGHRPMGKPRLAGFFTPLSFLVSAWFLLSVFACQQAFAAEVTGRVVLARGDVSCSLDEGETWAPAVVDLALHEGDCVRVGPGSEAALLLLDRSQIRLAERSLFCLTRSGDAPGQGGLVQGLYKLLRGELWFRNKRRGPKPVFMTPMVTAGIRGTEMAISVTDNEATSVTVLEGKVRCSNRWGEVVISRGQAVHAAAGTPPSVITLLRPEDTVQWLLVTPDILGPQDRDLSDPAHRRGVEIAQEAIKALVRSDVPRALDLAQEGVRMAPSRAAPRVALATVLQSAGRFDEALAEARRAVALDPLSVPALARAVELLLGLDRIGAAREVLTDFSGEPDPRVFLLRGYMDLVDLDPYAAAEAFDSVIEEVRDCAPAYLGRGLAQYRLKETEKALDSMERACLLEPLAAYPHNYLGKALHDLGERSEAEVELRRAVQLDPNDPTPHLYLATLLTDTFQPAAGITALQRAIALNDNHLPVRSRFLLDQDRAVKNVSLGWALFDLGLIEWARMEGDLAILDDPTNSGAYLLRAVDAISASQFGAGTLGDVRRANLLKPVNANTYISYKDYQSLIERPGFRATASGLGGSDKTLEGSLWWSGGTDRAAGSVFTRYAATDGPTSGAGECSSLVEGETKIALDPRHEVYFLGHAGRSYREDIRPWIDGDLDPQVMDTDGDFWYGVAGYRWHHGAGRDLLALVQGDGGEADLTSTIHGVLSADFPVSYRGETASDSYDRTWKGELLQFWRIGEHRLAAGTLLEDTYSSWFSEERVLFDLPFLNFDGRYAVRNHARDYRIYIEDIWHTADDLILDMGLSWTRIDGLWEGEGGAFIREEILPQAGLVWTFFPRDTFRAAYFQALQPRYTGGGLQPSDVVGFLKVTGAVPGTWTWFYGLGWDRRWGAGTITRVKLFRQDNRYPTDLPLDIFLERDSTGRWKDERINGLVLVLEKVLTGRVGLAFSYSLSDVRLEDPTRHRIDHALVLGLRYVHPSGFKAGFLMNAVHQDENSGYEEPEQEDFLVFSVSVSKSFLDKRGLVFLKGENITGEKFRFIPQQLSQVRQLPWQGGRIVAGIEWNF